MPPFYSSYSNEAGTVVADNAGFVRLKWHAAPRSMADFQAVLEQVVRVLQASGKVLIDQRLMPPLSEQEQARVSTQWLPRAVAQGHYRYAAVLPAADPQARRATEQVRTDAAHHPGLPRYVDFPDEEQARRWLHRQVIIQSRM